MELQEIADAEISSKDKMLEELVGQAASVEAMGRLHFWLWCFNLMEWRGDSWWKECWSISSHRCRLHDLFNPNRNVFIFGVSYDLISSKHQLPGSFSYLINARLETLRTAMRLPLESCNFMQQMLTTPELKFPPHLSLWLWFLHPKMAAQCLSHWTNQNSCRHCLPVTSLFPLYVYGSNRTDL